MRKNRYTIDRSRLNSLNGELLKKMYREKVFLMPYFIIDEGKEVFLKTLEILYSDRHSDYTILTPKPGAFKTSKQEDGCHDYSPFENKAFTVSDYRRGINGFDFFEVTMREIFFRKEDFDTVYSFYEENFDKLKFNYLKK